MPLPLFQEEPDDIHVRLRGSRQRDAIGPRCAGRGLSDAQSRWSANWHDPRDRRLTVEHGDGLAAAHRAQVLAQARLELRDTNFFHGHIMTRSSHVGKAVGTDASRSGRRPLLCTPVAVTASQLEEIASWCQVAAELAEERQQAWRRFVDEDDPRPARYWPGAGHHSRLRRFLGWFMFDQGLPRDDRPAARAARVLYRGAAQTEALGAVAGRRFVLAIVTSVLPGRSVLLELEDDIASSNGVYWLRPVHAADGGPGASRQEPCRIGLWVLAS